jgi:hypothetical protein
VKRALLFGALWLAATAATGAVAWGAVRLAGEQTAEQAVRPMTARQVEALATSTSAATPASTTFTTAATTLPPPTTSSTATTSTSALPASSTTTEAPITAARQTPGGTVVVSLHGGRLSLVGATPAAGFFVEVEESGPDEVVVVFEGGEGSEIRVRASVDGDGISFEVGTEEDD